MNFQPNRAGAVKYVFGGRAKDNPNALIITEYRGSSPIFHWRGFMDGNQVTMYPAGYYGSTRRLDDLRREKFKMSVFEIESEIKNA